MSISSTSSNSSASKGGAWRSQVYFDQQADVKGTGYWISDEELRNKLMEMIDGSEEIKDVRLYKVPLGEWQLTNALLYHVFVMFETEYYWWTVEKNSEGITIQRSRKFDAVVNNYRQEKRCKTGYWKPELFMQDKGLLTMTAVVDVLYGEDFLNQPYSWLSSNCKHFAQAFFNKVAYTKRW